MIKLTRAEAKSALVAGGWPSYLLDTMVAIGAAESRLQVDVTSPRNANGTEDYGWLQINSIHCGTSTGKFDKTQILSNATYAARCAFIIFTQQGLKAWASYNNGLHVKYLPPHAGGPDFTSGAVAWFLVMELQEKLNAVNVSNPPLVVDGSFGPKTKAALTTWQTENRPERDGVVRDVDSIRLLK